MDDSKIRQEAIARALVMTEVLREELVRKGKTITGMSRDLGRAQSFLTRSFTAMPGQGPPVKLQTILEVLGHLGVPEKDYFARVVERLEKTAPAREPEPERQAEEGDPNGELKSLMRSVQSILRDMSGRLE